jgi:erythrin-vacuolar iron transport family protein
MKTQDEIDKSFLLKVVQPGLAGLMDGSVSTLAPIFAAAFATHSSRIAFIIGLSAATGAGISMAFAEALSDTGEHTGRGHPVVRGVIIGAMTFLGGILHTLPFLVPDLRTALYLATIVVGVELVSIAYLRYHFFKMRFFLSIVQVVFGGALVFLAGYLIGSS